MTRQRPIIVVQKSSHTGLISAILVIFAWPLALVYWLYKITLWLVGTTIDWLTLGPIRRRRQDQDATNSSS